MEEISAPRSVISSKVVNKASEGSGAAKASASSPIGMFDSGVGGLSVLKEVERQLPREEVVYFADTARLPYGGRPPNEIVRFNYEIFNYLISAGCKAVIMACGTSSAIAYPIMKEHYKMPIISLIEPGSGAAVRATENGKIGVIATQATIDSSAYQRTIKKMKKDVEVTGVACPLFVPLIEGGFTEAEETRRVAAQYLKPLIKAGIDTLVLGCTHYPHLIKILREIAGIKIRFIDPAEEAVAETKKILHAKGLASSKAPGEINEKYHFYVSGSAIQFQDAGSRIFGKPIHNVKQVTLPKAGRRQAAK